MRASRLIAVIFIPLLLIPSCANSKKERRMVSDESAPSRATAVNPFMADHQTFQLATRALFGEVTAQGESKTTIKVDQVLRGDQGEAGTSVEFSHGLWLPPLGFRGYCFIIDGEQAGLIRAVESERSALRILADLPADDPAPSASELRELFAQSEGVVVATTVTTGPESADITITNTLKGDLTGSISVTRGYTTNQAGGAWTFTQSDSLLSDGIPSVYFLKSDGNDWLVINPFNPNSLGERTLKDALAHQ